MRSTIGGKIGFAFLVLLALMVAVVGITIQGFNKVTSSIDALERESVKRGASGNLRFAIAQLLMASNDYIITEKEYYRREYNRLNAHVDDVFRQFLQLSPTDEEQQILRGIKQDLDSIRFYSAQIFAVEHPRQSPKAWALIERMNYYFGDVVNRKTTEIFDNISRRIENHRRLAAANRENASNSIYGILFLSVLIGLLVSYLTVQRIAKPILVVTEAANGIAGGDYSQRPAVKTHDEVAILAQSFSRMAESIQQSQRALQESKRLTEAIVSTVPSGLLVFSSDGTILSVNNSFCDLFGFPHAHLIGRNIATVLEEVSLAEECRSRILARQPVRNDECSCRHPSQGTRTLSVTLFPMRLSNGESLLVVEDITQRKRAEQVISDSEQRFRALIENSSDGIIIVSAEGRLLYESPGSSQILGFPHGAWLNRNVFTLIHPDDYPSIMNLFAQLLKEPSRVLKAELRVRHRDGEWRWIETVAKNCLHDITIKGVVMNFRDVTERKRAEEAVRQSEARLAAAQRIARLGSWDWDIVTDELYWSDEVYRIFGVQPHEFSPTYQKFLGTVHPDDRAFVQESVNRALQEKAPYSIDHRILLPDGTEKFVHEDAAVTYNEAGNPVRMAGTVQDITERKRMEREIRQAEERYRGIFEYAVTGIFQTTPEGRFLSVNPRMAHILGYDSPEDLIQSRTDITHQGYVDPKRREEFHKLMERIGSVSNFEYEAYRKDGTTVWVSESARAVRDSEGRVLFYEGFFEDITERKRAEEALRRSEERFRTVTEQTGQLIYDYNTATGTISWAGGIEQITGYSPSEFQSFDIRRWEEHIHPEDRPRALQLLDESMKARSPYHAEYRFLKKDGSYATVEDRGIFLYDAAGVAYRMLGTMSDISWRKHTEEKLQHQHQTLQALAAVGQSLTSSLDLNIILSRILEALSRLFGCSSSAVLLYNPDAGTLSIVAQQGYDARLIDNLVIHVGMEGITGDAVQKRKAIYVPDVALEPHYVVGKKSIRTELAIPLMVAGYVIGVLDVQDEQVNAFDSEKISVLTQFADYAAVAIENARLFHQTQWQLKELFVINEIMRLSQSGLSFEEVIQAAAEALSQQFHYYCVTVFLRENDDTARRICSFGEGSALLPDTDVIPVKECLVGKVLETGKPVVVNDLGQEPQFARWVGSTTQSRLCVPIKRGNVLIGAINIDSEKKYAFRSTDVATVSSIAAQLSATDERVRLLENLRTSEQKYMSLYENAPDMYHTQDENGVIIMCNETMAKALGYAKEQIVGHSILEFMPEEFKAGCNAARTAVLNQGAVSDFECQLRKRDGSLVDVLVSARSEQLKQGKALIHVAMRDVTEKKRTERELLHFANALSQTADSVMITDRDGVIQYVNNAFEKTTGFTKEQTVGKTPRIVKSGLHPKEFFEELWKTILAGKVYRGIFINRRKTGELYYEEKTITPVMDRFGKVTHFVSAGRDVTEQRKLEQHLAQVQKMETIGTLASGIAHDFNNILAGIGAYTELLERRGYAQWQAAGYGKQIDLLRQRGEELTRSLLSFVRREERERYPVNIADLVGEIVQLAEKTFPKTISILGKAGTEPLWVQGNRTELYQVLLNLCVNARDAMPKGGTLSIEAAQGYLPDEMRKSLTKMDAAVGDKMSGGTVQIKVSDTGMGIPFSVLNKIFDPFFTTKPPGKGTGLGLSVVYNIVRNHDGLIDVQSTEGKGTTFTIILPAIESPARHPTTP